MLKQLLIIFCLIPPSFTLSQSNILHEYVQVGVKNNLAFQQKKFSLKKSIQALTEARGMFLPSVMIDARYSRAGGGRLIEIPIGDLMNPVYRVVIIGIHFSRDRNFKFFRP